MELKYQARRLIHGVIKERWYAGQENKSPVYTAPGGGESWNTPPMGMVKLDRRQWLGYGWLKARTEMKTRDWKVERLAIGVELDGWKN